MLCAGGGSRKSDGVTPSLTLNMHLNPPASHGPPSSAASSRPTTRPSSGRSATSRSTTAHAATAGGGAEAAAVASVQLRPSTVWLSLPLLQRLQSFFEPLSNLPAAVTQDDRCAILLCVCQLVQHVMLALTVTAHTPGSCVRDLWWDNCLRCFAMLHTCFLCSQLAGLPWSDTTSCPLLFCMCESHIAWSTTRLQAFC